MGVAAATAAGTARRRSALLDTPMTDYYINANVHTRDTQAVLSAVRSIFTAQGFTLLADTSARDVVEDDEALPSGSDWYGVVVSGASGRGWVSVYVEDWQDSGLLAQALSKALSVDVLEVWVAEDVHWGYTLFKQGAVADRYADDPQSVAETLEEVALYAGRASTFGGLLSQPADTLQATLETAHTQAGKFAGPGIDALAQAVGLPFEHVFTGYEFFFSDDPEDYGPSFDHWDQFRHLAFRTPAGRDTLAD